VLGMGMDVEMLDDAGSPLHLANHSQPQGRPRKQADLPPGAQHADDMQQQLDQGQRSLLRQQQQQQQAGVQEEDEENGLLLLDIPLCMPTPASPVHHPLEDCGLLGAAAARGAGQGAAGGLLQGAGSPGVSDDVLTALALEEPLQDLLQGGLEAAEVSVWVRGARGNGATSTAWLCWLEGHCYTPSVTDIGGGVPYIWRPTRRRNVCSVHVTSCGLLRAHTPALLCAPHDLVVAVTLLPTFCCLLLLPGSCYPSWRSCCHEASWGPVAQSPISHTTPAAGGGR
jgi:hypothetical protein